MPFSPTIRTFTPLEWPLYKSLRLGALAESPDSFGATLAQAQEITDTEWEERIVNGQDHRWHLPLLAELNGEPVGMAWGRITEATPDTAWLYQMWVSPNHRGMKVGKLLLNTVIAWATAHNAQWLHLDVRDGNGPAQQLYRRAGFEPFGALEPVRPGSPLFAQPMRLALQPIA